LRATPTRDGPLAVQQRHLVLVDAASVRLVAPHLVVETEVIWEPNRLVDPVGEVVGSVTEFLQELQASGRSAATQRSYALVPTRSRLRR
jgi:hypothetical protein